MFADTMEIDEPMKQAAEGPTKEVPKKKGQNARRKEHIRVKAIREKYGGKVEHLSDKEILSIINNIPKNTMVDKMAKDLEELGLQEDLNSMEDHFAGMKIWGREIWFCKMSTQ